MTFKKWQKPPKKWEKLSNVETVEVENEAENVGTTIVEEEINNVVDVEPTKLPDDILWTVWNSVVAKPKWRIKFEAQVAAFPMFKLPADIRQYLTNNWLTSDVYKKDKEWLEKHNVDMKMVEKLKQFLTTL